MPEVIVSRKAYILTCMALLVLTLLTWQAARLDLGRWNIVLAMAIAFTKASLVALFFMHQRYATGRSRLALIAGLFWFGILLLLTFADYFTRV